MIIVSQDKKTIINFENVEAISISDYFGGYRIICTTSAGWFVLGDYYEEECRRVFELIINDLEVHLATNKNNIIYMPQSGELNED